LRDGIEETQTELARPKLSYPFEQAPETGEAVDIAPGLKWLRMPLGGSLAFINVWAIQDGDGWAIVDTGMGGADTQAAWRQAFAGPLAGKTVTRVFVTHMHPDHIGMAGWLTR
jgi:glyoxylase-like metal-dependent hydrolase (beta-lactamase superfamily II)